MISFDAYMSQFIDKDAGDDSKSQEIVLQPRMGFSGLEEMSNGLQAVEKFPGPRIATITLDSKTRQKKFEDSRRAHARGEALNGFPIVAHGPERTAELISGIQASCPVQMRHGSPDPTDVFKVALDAGINATEGGPISYCLPYGRVPLKDSIAAWRRASGLWADGANSLGVPTHIESFGGCMMGQLCPPSLLIAISVLEGMFFQSAGVRSISLSVAQGTNDSQDIGAIIALRKLAETFLGSVTRWHVVFYAFMGLFPRTREGASLLITQSGRTAAIGGAHRVIVKTTSEARQIPSIEENIQAMELTAQGVHSARDTMPDEEALRHAGEIFREATQLIQVVLGLSKDIDSSLGAAFEHGYLDVPYCIHPDNLNNTRSFVDPLTGTTNWLATGNLPISRKALSRSRSISSETLLSSLQFNQRRYERSRV